MEWSIVGVNFLYAVLGVAMMFLSYRVIDWLTPQIDFAQELKRGNMAIGIVVAALFLAIAIVIGQALS